MYQRKLFGKINFDINKFQKCSNKETLIMKQKLKIIEIFNEKEPYVKSILQEIFKSYVEEKINYNKDLNNKK